MRRVQHCGDRKATQSARQRRSSRGPHALIHTQKWVNHPGVEEQDQSTEQRAPENSIIITLLTI
jgi:hypothetical protein